MNQTRTALFIACSLATAGCVAQPADMSEAVSETRSALTSDSPATTSADANDYPCKGLTDQARDSCCIGLRHNHALAALALEEPLSPGSYRQTLKYKGLDRHYTVDVPSHYDGTMAVPLVLDVHGWVGKAVRQARRPGYQAVTKLIR